jgi:hypothetical protein
MGEERDSCRISNNDLFKKICWTLANMFYRIPISVCTWFDYEVTGMILLRDLKGATWVDRIKNMYVLPKD